MLFTLECETSGCHVAGDQYTMVRCRGCGGWFCTDHIDAQESVTLIYLAPRALKDLAYYQGVCQTCQ
jgi:hypothetical protein